ncbi:hypothetical protein WISP_142315 [Willisornis vidua]|uniref:Uncharacterized protein n=1 Tax=Willisornis vidua TaxID=1566151 RepID=A0ABQ9CRN7_9PASS|nr:hypothetical protein WISP_142315 [Willisornis vidua]
MWGNTAEDVFEEGKKIVQTLLKVAFAIKQSKENIRNGKQEYQVAETSEGEGELTQFAEKKTIQLTLDIAIDQLSMLAHADKCLEGECRAALVGPWHPANINPALSPIQIMINVAAKIPFQ